MQFDLDRWESLGNPGWSYEDCLPVLKRIETDEDFGDQPHHGSDGPLTVKRRIDFEEELAPPMQAFVDRAKGLGLLRDEGRQRAGASGHRGVRQ